VKKIRKILPYYQNDWVTLFKGDCLGIMKQFEEDSFDMVLTDLPYGTTQNKWDSIIDLEKMWKFIFRITTKKSALIFTGTEPFSSILRISNLEIYKYDWIWNKVNRISGFLNSKKQPLRNFENIIVFYRKQCTYNPIMEKGKPYKTVSKGKKSSNYGKQSDGIETTNEGNYYPKQIIDIKADKRGKEGRLHPTQKPVALFEYLIKTYTNEGDTVLDCCAGSGTTGVACMNLGRKCVLIEKDEEEKYCDIIVERLKQSEQESRRGNRCEEEEGK